MTDEDEAFEEIERRQNAKQRFRVKTVDEAYNDWVEANELVSSKSAREAFTQGWVAGIRNEWLKERND